MGIVVDRGMAVHTNVQRRDRGVSAVHRIAMAIQTADLVDAGVNPMRIEDRLDRLIALLTAQPDSAFHHPVTAEHEEDQHHRGDIYLFPSIAIRYISPR